MEQTRLQPDCVARVPVYMLSDRIIIREYLERAEPGWQRQPQTLREWASPYLGALERLALDV